MLFITPSNIHYRPATSVDFEKIGQLLHSCRLPNHDLNPQLQYFFVAEMGNTIIGCAAIEVYGNDGLFRSLAVSDAFRNLKVSEKLLSHIIQLSKEKELSGLYLLTTTAPEYFRKKGWVQIERDTAPHALTLSTEFASVCPASAICMSKQV
jgi:amino-acid N-acetyltransferase